MAEMDDGRESGRASGTRGHAHSRNAAATKARLLEAARELFLSQGFGATGLRQIAAAAEVDVTLVRRYFGSKRALFVEATAVSDDIQAIWKGSDAEIATRLVQRVLSARRDVEAPLFALLRSSGDPEVVERLNTQFEEGLTRPLAARITADDPDLRADMVTALLIGIGVLRSLLNKDPLAKASEEKISAIFAEGFRALAMGIAQGAEPAER
jgi:AcrR family transcriptional regulator